jgi:hypothetical protein
MSDENQKDDPGTDPETQREELTGRSKVVHPAGERSKMLNTKRPDEAVEREDEEGEERS